MKIQIENVSGKNLVEKSAPNFEFREVKPDINKIKELDAEKYDNLVVIGNGGSITTFRAYYYAFMDRIDKGVRIVTTMDPDYLSQIKEEFEPQNTLVIAISKSGTTTGVIESLLYFTEKGYDALTVTSDKDSPLKKITEKRDYEWVEHKDIGGRFSGLTETALVPAHLTGAIDIEKIREGGEEFYNKLDQDNNPAQKVAKTLYQAEQQGYEEILTPIYSARLYGYLPLQIQLMHETVCKNGEGQTIYGDLGPEYQHHTNQRLFGGKQNVIPLFITLENHEKDERIHIEKDIRDIELKNHKLKDLEANTYSQSLKKEYKGVKQTLIKEKKPLIEINLKEIKEKAIGEYTALLQSIAVYSAHYRNVNPYNQPDVEKSKIKGFEERFNNK